MPTTDFKWLDKLIASWRFRRVWPYLQPQSKVLDFGCGSSGAFLVAALKKQPRLTTLVGVDLGVEAQIIQDKIKLLPLDPKGQTLLHLPDKFDLITMLAVIEHLPPAKVPLILKQLRRKLKTSGMIVLTTPTHWGKYVLEFMAFKLKIISPVQIHDHKKYYRRQDFLSLAAACGLRVQKYHYFCFGLNSLIVLVPTRVL